MAQLSYPFWRLGHSKEVDSRIQERQIPAETRNCPPASEKDTKNTLNIDFFFAFSLDQPLKLIQKVVIKTCNNSLYILKYTRT